MIAQNEAIADIEAYSLIAKWPDLSAFQQLLDEVEAIRHAAERRC